MFGYEGSAWYEEDNYCLVAAGYSTDVDAFKNKRGVGGAVGSEGELFTSFILKPPFFIIQISKDNK